MAIFLDELKSRADWSLTGRVEFALLGALSDAVWFGSVFI
jgi:hypothetical protein